MGLGLIMAAPGTVPIADALAAPDLAQGPPSPAATIVPDAWMALLGKLPLAYQPGAAWLYSTSADVLGVLIARAAGQSLEGFLRERLFAPLGMRDTGFSVPPGRAAAGPAVRRADDL